MLFWFQLLENLVYGHTLAASLPVITSHLQFCFRLFEQYMRKLPHLLKYTSSCYAFMWMSWMSFVSDAVFVVIALKTWGSTTAWLRLLWSIRLHLSSPLQFCSCDDYKIKGCDKAWTRVVQGIFHCHPVEWLILSPVEWSYIRSAALYLNERVINQPAQLQQRSNFCLSCSECSSSLHPLCPLSFVQSGEHKNDCVRDGKCVQGYESMHTGNDSNWAWNDKPLLLCHVTTSPHFFYSLTAVALWFNNL